MRAVWTGVAGGALALFSCGGRAIELQTLPDAGSTSVRGASSDSLDAGGHADPGDTVMVTAEAATPPVCPSTRASSMLDVTKLGDWPQAPLEIVWYRLTTFLTGRRPPFPAPPPNEFDRAIWLRTQAAVMLDQAAVDQVPVEGFRAFLSQWTRTVELDGTLKDWAQRMSTPGADLATLLTGETADPRRRGILTEPQLLAARPGIVGRGVWMLGALFCFQVPAPPPDVHSAFPLPSPAMSTRRGALASVVNQPPCISCHSDADELGFSLEHFDESGMFRDTDNGQDVDSSGVADLSALSSYQDAPLVNFMSIDDLAPDLARSCGVASCFVQSMLSSALGSYDGLVPSFTDRELQAVDSLTEEFASSGFSMRELILAMVVSPLFSRP